MTTSTPPTIIAFASSKGGAGKSTSCLAIAGALARRGETVHIVDFDFTQTLFRWYASNQSAQDIPNLTVEEGPPEDELAAFVSNIWNTRSGYVLIDLAGGLTDQMLLLATFAHLTVIPAKLSEPDILEAGKLSHNLDKLAEKLGKPIAHRILINEVPSFLAAFQQHTLTQIQHAPLARFETLFHTRAGYPESFFSGVPPHYADQSRETIAKAVAEIDHLMREVDEILQPAEEQKAAA